MRTSAWLRTPFAALLVAAAASAVSAKDALVESRFEATDRGGLLRLSDGVVKVDLTTFRRYRTVLTQLKPGDEVSYELNERGGLAQIERKSTQDPTPARTVRETIGKYQSLKEDPSGSFWWLSVGGQKYQLDQKTYEAMGNVLLFLKGGEQLLVRHRQNWVVEVTEDIPEVEVQEHIRELVKASQRDDVVFVEGNEFRFRSGNDTDIALHPKTPDGRISDGIVRYTLRELEAKGFVNAQAEARLVNPQDDGEEGPRQDVFADVRVGDTIGIDLADGQVIELTPETVTLKIWKSERWIGEKTWNRAEVDKIRPVRLNSEQAVPLGAGVVSLRVNRWRDRSGLRFEVDLSHDLETSLLVGVRLRFHLGDAAMALSDPALETEILDVPDLFANDRIVVTHAVQRDEYLDGRVEVLVTPQNALPIESGEAKPHIVTAIAAARSDPQRLSQVYLAAGRNGAEDLIRLLIDRALYPPGTERPVQIRNGELALRALALCAQRAASELVRQLHFMDRNLKRYLIYNNAIREQTLSTTKQEPLDHKDRLARLLGKLPGGISGSNGRRLFDLYLLRSNLQESIEAAFNERPDESLDTLLSVATSLHSGSSEDERVRALRAAEMLQRLGEPMIKPLLTKLRSQGIDVRELEAYSKTQGVPASDVIERGLSFLIEQANARRRAELNTLVDNSQLRQAEGDWAGALELLREVLAIDPEQSRAKEQLPTVLLELAQQAKAQDRGQAALYLEETITLLEPNLQSRAKTPLAELYLAALNEEIQGVVIRDRPHRAANQLALAAPGAPMPGEEVDNTWVAIEANGQTGYIRSKVVSLAAPGSYQVTETETPYGRVLKPLLDDIRAMSPAIGSQVDEAEGSLMLREAMARYEAGEYQVALKWFEDAGELVPGDDRLATRKWAWLHAYSTFVMGGLGLLVVAGLIAGATLFARPKKVKFEGEFKHYGADRAERERGLDLEEGAPDPAGGEEELY